MNRVYTSILYGQRNQVVYSVSVEHTTTTLVGWIAERPTWSNHKLKLYYFSNSLLVWSGKNNNLLTKLSMTVSQQCETVPTPP